MQPSTSFAFVTLTLAACATSEPVQITIHSRDGVEQHQLTREELTSAVADPVPSYRVDGAVTTDPSRLLHGTRLELPLPDHGGTLVATRTGNQLHTDALDVSWNTDLTALAVGDITIDIQGVDAGDRERLAGRLIETFVGADTGSTDLKADGGLTIAIILAVSYIGCLTGGNVVCGDVAKNTCSSSGVDEYKMICGAGFDVEGSFKLGMSCSFRCKP
jgi:hypothetical protein